MNSLKLTFLEGKRPFFWLSLICFLVYFQSLFFGYTYLDDNVLILDNLFFLKDPGNLFKAFTIEVFHILHSSASYYRPMLTVSYMVDSWFSGKNLLFYHFTSILIHAVNSCLLFVFLNKLKYDRLKSFLFSLVFVVHPVLTQAVVWVPGRNDSLLFLFGILSFIFFIDYLRSGLPKNKYLHVLFFALAIFTKESSIFLPVLFTYYLFLIEKEKIQKLLAIPWFFVYVLWFFLRSIALTSDPVQYKFLAVIKSILENSPALILFIGKVFFPFNLNVLPTLVDSTLIYGIISTILILVLTILTKNKRWVFIIFSIVFFVLFLSPSFIRPDSSYMPDFIEHRIYFPIIGIFILLMEINPLKSIKGNALIISLMLIVLVFFVSTFLYSRNFKDKITFWKNAAQNSPSHPLSHKNLGAMYYLDGNFNDAKIEFEKAVELNPNEQMIYNNLGLIYYQKGDYEMAEKMYVKELEINPGYDNAYFNWGLLYYKKGEFENAINMWEKTLISNPDHVGAYQSLAKYYLENKEYEKASFFADEARKRGADI